MLRVLLYALWLFAPALQSAIGYSMWTRRLYRDYPVFFAYILNQAVIFFVLIYCYQLSIRDEYRQSYLAPSAVSSAAATT